MSADTDGIYEEKYIMNIPMGISPVKYDLKIKIYSEDEGKDVFLALD